MTGFRNKRHTTSFANVEKVYVSDIQLLPFYRVLLTAVQVALLYLFIDLKALEKVQDNMGFGESI